MSQAIQLPGYNSNEIPEHILVRDAQQEYRFLLGKLAGVDVPGSVAEIAKAIGHDRARRGVELANLLTAVRLDFEVLWKALKDLTHRDEQAMLLDYVEDVWGVVEEFTREVQMAYLDESHRLSLAEADELSAAVNTLLDEPNPTASLLARAAAALGVGVDDRFFTIAAHMDQADSLRSARGHLTAQGRVAIIAHRESRTLLIAKWVGETSDLTGLKKLLPFPHLTGGLGPIAEGLSNLNRSACIAIELSTLRVAKERLAHLDDSLVALASQRLTDIQTEVIGSVLSGLSSCTPAERRRLLKTVAACIEHGSTSRAAEFEFCHRNTIINRVNRFTELTGLDPFKTKDSARLALALELVSGGDLETSS